MSIPPKKQADDLMHLDLDEIVKGTKEDKSEISSATPPIQEECQSITATLSIPHSWENFLIYHQEYSSQKSHHRRNIYIEHDIIDLFNNCDIQGGRTSNLINAALRSFIEDHKSFFKASLRPRPTLIQLD